jgi:chromosome segregation ATPase
MSEEQTDRLEGGTPFEIRVLRELANINHRLTGLESRLTTLEEKVDARLHDTRPICEAVLSRLDSIESRLDNIEARLKKVETKFEVVADELLDVRSDVRELQKRPPAA